MENLPDLVEWLNTTHCLPLIEINEYFNHITENEVFWQIIVNNAEFHFESNELYQYLYNTPDFPIAASEITYE